MWFDGIDGRRILTNPLPPLYFPERGADPDKVGRRRGELK